MNEDNIFAEYPDCVADRHKLRGVLLDFFPGEKLTANLIMTAFDAGIVGVIKRATRLDEKTQLKIWGILTEEFGLKEDHASWTVSYWMTNYGVYVLRKPFDFVELPSSGSQIRTDSANTGTNKTEIENLRAENQKLKERLDAAIVECQAANEAAEKAKARATTAEAEAETAKAAVEVARAEAESAKAAAAVARAEAAAAKVAVSANATKENTTQSDDPSANGSVKNGQRTAGQGDVSSPQCSTLHIEGAVSLLEMEDDAKFPKERVILFPDEYAKLGITNFRATAYKLCDFTGHCVLSVKGEYDGRTKEELLIVPMVFNETGDLVAVEFDEGISSRIRSHKTYATKFRAPNHEKVSRIEVKIIKNPVFLD